MQCKKCNKHYPQWITIDGKSRNLKSRKYCLDCSPFGVHNTVPLHERTRGPRTCSECGKEIRRKNERGKKCWVCTNRLQRLAKLEKLKNLTGGCCWYCGYDKCWSALDFHHVIPKLKEFQITMRELQYTWERVLHEVQKCVLFCCRCHREVHAKIISEEEVLKIWKEKWKFPEQS